MSRTPFFLSSLQGEEYLWPEDEPFLDRVEDNHRPLEYIVLQHGIINSIRAPVVEPKDGGLLFYGDRSFAPSRPLDVDDPKIPIFGRIRLGRQRVVRIKDTILSLRVGEQLVTMAVFMVQPSKA